jgi:hypothetical protein
MSAPARDGLQGNPRVAPLERVTYAGTSWDLAPARVTGRQGTAARSPRAVGSGDARNRPQSGPNGCAGRDRSSTMQKAGASPPLRSLRAPRAPENKPLPHAAQPPGAAPRHRRCPDVGADRQGPAATHPAGPLPCSLALTPRHAGVSGVPTHAPGHAGSTGSRQGPQRDTRPGTRPRPGGCGPGLLRPRPDNERPGRSPDTERPAFRSGRVGSGRVGSTLGATRAAPDRHRATPAPRQ